MLLSTAYLGNIQYFSKLSTGMAQIEGCENFQKQTYRNRADIMTAGGVRALTVPVVWRHGDKMPIREVYIDYTQPWQREHWRTLTAAYAAAPYFDHYAEKLAPFYDYLDYAPETLWELNYDLTFELLLLLDLMQDNLLEFTTDYALPSPLDKAPETGDFRECISHKPRLRRPDPTFSAPEYYQIFADRQPFGPNLSAIDLLFCEGPQAGYLIRNSYRKQP